VGEEVQGGEGLDFGWWGWGSWQTTVVEAAGRERVSVWACVGKKGEEQYQQKSWGYVVSGDLWLRGWGKIFGALLLFSCSSRGPSIVVFLPFKKSILVFCPHGWEIEQGSKLGPTRVTLIMAMETIAIRLVYYIIFLALLYN
jgi:hypothetical protein